MRRAWCASQKFTPDSAHERPALDVASRRATCGRLAAQRLVAEKGPHHCGRRSADLNGKNNRPGDSRACFGVGPNPASCRLRPVMLYRDGSVFIVPMACPIMPPFTAAFQHVRTPLTAFAALDELTIAPNVRGPVPRIVSALVNIAFPRCGHDLDAFDRRRDTDFNIDVFRRLPDCSETKRADRQRQGGNNISQLHNISLSLIAPKQTRPTRRDRGGAHQGPESCWRSCKAKGQFMK